MEMFPSDNVGPAKWTATIPPLEISRAQKDPRFRISHTSEQRIDGETLEFGRSGWGNMAGADGWSSRLARPGGMSGFDTDENGESVAVRRVTQGIHRASGCQTSSSEVVTGSTAWIGKGLSCVCVQRRDSDARLSFDLTPSQEECLQGLQNRIEVSYDGSKVEHQESLRALWSAAFPGVKLHDLISDQWKEMGWQGKDPSTDFRGGGFISLENLLFFAKNFPKTFQDLLRKQGGDRALWEYPFAVAGVNITFMLIQMLDLQAVKPRTLMGEIFLKLLSENERAFDILYCITFKLLDQQWLTMHASYMDFNSVMKSTRRQLERELLLEDIQRIEEMPSFGLLI